MHAAFHVIAVLLIWGTALVIYGFIAVGVKDLWKNRAKPMVSKRHMSLVSCILFGSIGMVYGCNFAVYVNANKNAKKLTADSGSEEGSGPSKAFVIYVIMVYAVSVYLMICSVLARLWLITFDMHYSMLIGDKVWITLISSTCMTRRQISRKLEQESARAERLEKIKQTVRSKSPIPAKGRSSTLRIEITPANTDREESVEPSITDVAGSTTRSASSVPFFHLLFDDEFDDESEMDSERRRKRKMSGIRPVRSFWCRYKATLGNPRFVINFLLPLTVITFCLIDGSIFFGAPKLYFIWQTASFGTLCGLCGVVRYSIPRMSDSLYIHEEARWMINWAVIAVTFIICLWIIPLWYVDTISLRTSWAYIWFAVACVNLGMVAFACTPVFYPLYHLLEEKRQMEAVRSSMLSLKPVYISFVTAKFLDFWSSKYDYLWEHVGFPIRRLLWQIENNAFDTNCTLSQCTKLRNDYAIKLGVPGVLSKRESLSLFMNHLINEFSTENMLALIEFVHFRVRFKCEVMNKTSDDENNDSNNKNNDIIEINDDLEDMISKSEWYEVISNDIPVPTVVWNEEADAYSVVNSLCDRYVLAGAEYELNLSYACRTDIMSVLASMAFMERTLSNKQLATMFDVAIGECLTLMKDSFQRWNRTPDFDRYATNLQPPTVEAVREANERSKMKTSSADLSVSPAMVRHTANATPSSTPTVDYPSNNSGIIEPTA